jgi:hypothetical protein
MACAAELPLDGQLEPSWLRIASAYLRTASTRR